MNRDGSSGKPLDNANLDYGTLPKHLGSQIMDRKDWHLRERGTGEGISRKLEGMCVFKNLRDEKQCVF